MNANIVYFFIHSRGRRQQSLVALAGVYVVKSVHKNTLTHSVCALCHTFPCRVLSHKNTVNYCLPLRNFFANFFSLPGPG